MSESNPYQPPSASMAPVVPASARETFLPTGRAVDAGRGWEWIAQGYALFKKAPGTWILVLIVSIACSALLHFVPIIGTLASMLLTQVLMAGLMLGCRSLDRGGEFEVSTVFAGFKQNTGDLVVLGVLALVGYIVIFLPAIGIIGGGAVMSILLGGSHAMSLGAMGMSFLLAMLTVFALAVPLYMALFFAPSLIVFNNLKPVEAMKASFYGCLKNIMPFLVYGVILAVLGVLAVIPLGLGFLVLGPVMIASIYISYRDIFTAG